VNEKWSAGMRSGVQEKEMREKEMRIVQFSKIIVVKLI